MEAVHTGIYGVVDTKTNSVKYVGQSVDIKRRWKDHRNYKGKNNILSKAFRKNGLDRYKFIILEECSQKDLDDKEIYWINKYDTYYNGYNATLGGGGKRGNVVKLTDKDVLEIIDLLKNSDKTEKEIAEMFNVRLDTISYINLGKSRKVETETYPIRKEIKKVNHCIECGKEIDTKAKRCKYCDHLNQRKIASRPSKEVLLLEVQENGYCATGRKYGVSDNTIRKWLKN